MRKPFLISLASCVLIFILFLRPISAFSQTYTQDDATEVILAGGGTDPSHTLSIKAPSLASSTTLTMPSSNASGYLTNDGSGNLSWSALSSGVTEVHNVNDSTTTSTSETAVGLRDFDIVPGAGDYLVLFNSYIENSGANNRSQISIYANGTQVAQSVRAADISSSSRYYPISTMAYISGLSAGQHISMEWHTSASTLKIHERTMIVMKLK